MRLISFVLPLALTLAACASNTSSDAASDTSAEAVKAAKRIDQDYVWRGCVAVGARINVCTYTASTADVAKQQGDVALTVKFIDASFLRKHPKMDLDLALTTGRRQVVQAGANAPAEHWDGKQTAQASFRFDAGEHASDDTLYVFSEKGACAPSAANCYDGSDLFAHALDAGSLDKGANIWDLALRATSPAGSNASLWTDGSATTVSFGELGK